MTLEEENMTLVGFCIEANRILKEGILKTENPENVYIANILSEAIDGFIGQGFRAPKNLGEAEYLAALHREYIAKQSTIQFSKEIIEKYETLPSEAKEWLAKCGTPKVQAIPIDPLAIARAAILSLDEKGIPWWSIEATNDQYFVAKAGMGAVTLLSARASDPHLATLKLFDWMLC